MKSVSTPSWRARDSTSRPETSGIRMSTRARSKLRARSASSASAPLATVTTVWPCCAQARSSTQRIDSSSSATRMVPGTSGSGVDMVLAHGKGDAKAGTTARARLVGDDAAVLRDDAMAQRQPEAGPARLGGEERREEVALGVLGHAGTGVRDGDREQLVAVRPAAHVVARLDAGGHRQLALAAERLDGVLDQVEEHLGQLRAVTEDRGQTGIELRAERDAAEAGRLALQRQDVVQDAVDVERRDLQLGRGAEPAELLHEAVQPVDLTDDDVGRLDVARIGEARTQELRRTLDAAQRVADLVRQAERHRAHGRQAVRTPRGGVERALERQIVEDEDRAAQHALLVVHGSAGRADRDLLAASAQAILAPPARQALLERRAGELREPGVRRPPGDELLDRHPGRLRGRDAEQLLRRWIEVVQE